MPRVYIGSYIIDAADSSSSSTTTGVKLRLNSETPASPEWTRTEYIWPPMHALVTAASESACKTASDAVVAAVRGCQGQTVKYEETNGTTLFQMHATVWADSIGTATVEQAGTTALITFGFTATSPGPVAAGAADEPGQIGEIVWSYQIQGGGIAAVQGTGTFGPTLSGDTVSVGARLNAVAWRRKMLTTSNFPSWMSANFRLITADPGWIQNPNQGTITEGSYNPATMTLTFAELDSTLAADSNWPALALSGNYTVSMQEREAIDVNSGITDPGFDFEITGSVLLKTQGATAFDSSESKIAIGSVYSSALAAVNCIITMFRATYTGFSLVQLGRPRINIDSIQGVAAFAVGFTSQQGITAWAESGMLENVYPKTFSRATNGAETVYKKKGGPVRTFTHSLKIASMSGPEPYRAPQLDQNWSTVQSAEAPLIESAYSNGVRVYVTTYNKTWRYVNPTPTNADPEQSNFSGSVLRMTNIGQGLTV